MLSPLWASWRTPLSYDWSRSASARPFPQPPGTKRAYLSASGKGDKTTLRHGSAGLHVGPTTLAGCLPVTSPPSRGRHVGRPPLAIGRASGAPVAGGTTRRTPARMVGPHHTLRGNRAHSPTPGALDGPREPNPTSSPPGGGDGTRLQELARFGERTLPRQGLDGLHHCLGEVGSVVVHCNGAHSLPRAVREAR